MVFGIPARIHLIFQLQKTQVAALVGAKAGDFDVVAQQIGIGGNLVLAPGEKLLLIIEARSPGEVRPHLEILAKDMPHHVRCMDSFGRLVVMGTTSSMNMMIAAPPSARRRIDPAF